LKVDSTRAGQVKDQIHSGLAIQEYNLLEVKLDPGAMHLFEEFGWQCTVQIQLPSISRPFV
jgi:hypothetical protein